MLLFPTMGEIRQFILTRDNIGEYLTIAKEEGDIGAVDFYVEQELVYWAANKTIKRARIPGNYFFYFITFKVFSFTTQQTRYSPSGLFWHVQSAPHLEYIVTNRDILKYYLFSLYTNNNSLVALSSQYVKSREPPDTRKKNLREKWKLIPRTM